jgi:hypothetical protein
MEASDAELDPLWKDLDWYVIKFPYYPLEIALSSPLRILRLLPVGGSPEGKVAIVLGFYRLLGTKSACLIGCHYFFPKSTKSEDIESNC